MQTKTFSTYYGNNVLFNHLEHSDINWSSTHPEAHNIYEIIYIKKGNLSYVAEGKKYKVEKNTILFTRPGRIHTIFFNDKSVYERYDIFFDKKIILPSVFSRLPEDIDVLNADGNEHIDNLFKKMDYYCRYFKNEEFENILAHLI